MRRFQEEMARRRSEEARRIGANIAALRERHHLTQEAAARKLKVAYRTYQSWEEGTSVPRWATRERIAKFYGVSVEEINGPPTPREDASTGLLDQLARIEANTEQILALLSRWEREDPATEEAEAAAVAADAAPLEAAIASPEKKAPGRSAKSRGAGGRRRAS